MPAPLDGIVERRVLAAALERMADDPVVLLEGPRAVGKSTLLRAIAANCGAPVLDLDDPATRQAVADAPGTVVTGSTPICVDEYQKGPARAGRDQVGAEPGRGTRSVRAHRLHLSRLPPRCRPVTHRAPVKVDGLPPVPGRDHRHARAPARAALRRPNRHRRGRAHLDDQPRGLHRPDGRRWLADRPEQICRARGTAGSTSTSL